MQLKVEPDIEDREHLEKTLMLKLGGIPKNFIPDFTLLDIINHPTNAVHLKYIPSDLQLPYFLANRRRINRAGQLAIKSSEDQHLNITRAIFFYRLDEHHQFQRYHDSHRWNVMIFLALLTKYSLTGSLTDSDRETGVNHKQIDFMVAYIEGVLEHHNNPFTFTKREEFIRMWKKEPYDFFYLRSGRKRWLRQQMKKMNQEFEKELDAWKLQLGAADYDRSIAKFAGAVIMARKDQGLERDHNGMLVEHTMALTDESGQAQNSPTIRSGGDTNDTTVLLKSLRVPLDEETDFSIINAERDRGARHVTVVSDDAGVAAVTDCSPPAIISMLIERFGTGTLAYQIQEGSIDY